MEERLYLIYFSQLFYPSIFGGGEYLFYMIAKQMAMRGHKVHIVTQRLANTSAIEDIDGITIHRVGSPFLFSGTLPPTIRHNLSYLLLAIRTGIRLIRKNLNRKNRIVIHSNPYVPALSGQFCSKFFRIPHVISFYDVYQAQNKDFWQDWMTKDIGNAPFYASKLAKVVERIVLRLNPSTYHTISETSSSEMVQFGVPVDKITLIPPGLDPREYNGEDEDAQSSNKYPTAVFAGRLIGYKNVLTIIRAFKIVIRSNPYARLIVIGDGPQREALIEEAREIEKNVVFTGRISHAEKLRLIKASSFITFPSILEGFGIAIIEAFACSKPVIVSDVKPLNEIVRDDRTGFVVPPFDVNMWADRIKNLFEDVVKQRRMGFNGYQEFIKKYQLDTVVDKLEILYYSCMKD